MKDKIESIEVAKAFFDAKEYSGSKDALFYASLKYGARINNRLKYLERRNKTLKGLYDQIVEGVALGRYKYYSATTYTRR